MMKICNKCKQPIKVTNKEDWLDIPELGISVEKAVHDKNSSWNELELSKKEDQLLTSEECLWLANSKYATMLKMDGSSLEDGFFIQQPFNLNKKNDYIARFSALSDGAILDCVRSPRVSFSSLGVRFKRPLYVKKEKK